MNNKENELVGFSGLTEEQAELHQKMRNEGKTLDELIVYLQLGLSYAHQQFHYYSDLVAAGSVDDADYKFNNNQKHVMKGRIRILCEALEIIERFSCSPGMLAPTDWLQQPQQ